jgi:hypothetical protein
VRRIPLFNPDKLIATASKDGMVHEAEEVSRCLQRGDTESPSMPLEESLRMMQAIDAIRLGWLDCEDRL